MKILALTNRISTLTNWFSGRNARKANSNLLKYGLVLLFSVALWGCGKGNATAPVTIDPVTGKHPAGMAVASTGGSHVDAYFASPAGCEGCHGKPGDLSGGIVKVSCSSNSRSGMTCHAGKFPHGIGFGNPVVHGAKARNAVIGTNGIAFCKKCHGSNYKGITGSGVSCIACHKLTTPVSNAPHAGDWLNGTFRHSATDESNAPACGECHLGGQKLAAPVLLPAGTPAPTCFGTTALCHFEAGHTNPYIAKTDHGLAARSNLEKCISCHATFPVGSTVPSFARVRGTTNLSPNGCQNCHTQTGLAHPFGWLPGRGTTVGQAGNNTTSHTTASFGATGEYCSPCHALSSTTPLPGSPAPSCMTQTAQIGGTTFCHFTGNPVANSGCKSCHGVNTANGQPDGVAGVAGVAAPNRDFRHGAHFAKMPGLTCAVCHSGSGTGQTSHATIAPGTVPGAVVAFPAVFSDTGAAVYLPNTQNGKCNFVSCHGGKQLQGILLGWRTLPAGTIGADCLACHTVSRVDPVSYEADPTKSYIGPFSGNNLVPDPAVNGSNLHETHVDAFRVAVCIDCHTLAAHFNNLMQGSRKLAPGFAAATVGGAGTKVQTYTFTNPTSSSCLSNVVGCHAGVVRSWYR